MVLDITLFRKEAGGDPDIIRESQRRRYASVEVVDEIIALDEKWRQMTFELDNLRKDKRLKSKEINEKRKAKDKDGEEALKKEVGAISQRIKQLEVDVETTANEIKPKLSEIGNIVHESVPVSDDEANNEIVRINGECATKPDALHHHELLAMIDGYSPERGVKVAGHRGYFLKGLAARLNMALITYSQDFLMKRGYTLLQTPFFMNKPSMAKTAQLTQFDEELYKVIGTRTEGKPGEEVKKTSEEMYLIATSEQPISAYHMDEWIQPSDLPLRYGGFSTCFRKEAGAHGKDNWGIFRVHQFEKVEQFCITAPEKSWEEHENMLKASEEFYQSLGLPYRVVTIVSKELNNAAAKKYDLEGWFPGFQGFRELVSCSNCTDYQSRSLEIRFGTKQKGEREKKYVHMLNSTLCATTRTICCILENHQTAEGVKVPEALVPYMGGIDFLPFTQPKPVTVAEGEAAGANKKDKQKQQKKEENN
ncbi:Cytosolic seryl-tRNA synthetase [Balamuthia mandrillaris]